MYLYAKMTPINYAIEYHLDGGVNDSKNPTHYNIEKDVTLADATKSGYSFDGWYLDESYTQPIYVLDAIVDKKVDLYARFLPFESTIDEDNNVTIVSYCGTGNKVDIPTTINGRKVVKINKNLLVGCNDITELSIPFVGELLNEINNPWIMPPQFLGQLFGADNYEDQNNYVPSTLRTVKVGYNVGKYSFVGCKNISCIYLSEMTSSVYSEAFVGCSGLKELVVNEDNQYFFSKGNCIISKKYNSLVVGCATSVIPEGENISIINAYAFSGCENLVSIDIPEGVVYIYDSAFENCVNLQSVKIANSVRCLGRYAFNGCTNLSEILSGDNIEEIGYDCLKNTAWYANQPDGLIYVGKVALKYKGTMSTDTSIVIKDGTKSIGEFAFYNCRNLIDVTLPDSVTRICDDAFFACSRLSSIDLPESLREIGSSSFGACDGLTTIYIPANVEWIHTGSFEGCSNLANIQVDKNNKKYHSDGNCLIETARKRLIAGCYTSVIPDDGSVTIIGIYAFEGMDRLTSINIPNSIKEIETFAFADCNGLTEVVIPSSVGTIGTNIFDCCKNLISIVVDDDNQNYVGLGNCLIEKDSKTLISGCKNSVIPDGSVTRIGESAFRGISWNNPTIPKSVTLIDKDAFMFFGYEPITYLGKMEEWNAIEKVYDFGSRTIICTDGTINERV